MDTSDYDYLFKVVVIGDSGVGKSSICTRYTKDIYHNMFISTIGVDFECHTICLDGKNIKLQIWDTAGQERFKAITNSFYRGADGIIIVFDVTSYESFHNVRKWLEEVNKRESETPYKLILGNKCDQENKRQVSFDTAKEYANQLDIPYLETSAKSAVNIDQAFLNMASKLKYLTISDSLSNSSHSRGTTSQSGNLQYLKSAKIDDHQSTVSCCQLM